MLLFSGLHTFDQEVHPPPHLLDCHIIARVNSFVHYSSLVTYVIPNFLNAHF